MLAAIALICMCVSCLDVYDAQFSHGPLKALRVVILSQRGYCVRFSVVLRAGLRFFFTNSGSCNLLYALFIFTQVKAYLLFVVGFL